MSETKEQVKHTPGPWKVGSGNLAHPHLDRVQAGDFVVFLGNSKGATQQEWEANARLIAAAPELLEALKEMAEVAAYPRLYKARTGIDACDVYERAQAAIAKAEGR